MADGGKMGIQKHTIHGLVEFDITDVRAAIRQHRSQTGDALSFSAFFLACLGKAIEQDKQMHAYRNWHNQLILFDEVDVNMLFEVEVNGKKTIRPHIIRGVNIKSIREIHDEIRAFQSGHESSQESKFIEWFVRLPGFIRRLFLRVLFMNPQFIKDYYGTVLVTSIGMFGTGSGWGIPVSNHSLQLTLGGIGEKPGVVDHRVEIRKYLSVTISFDHDVIDGAPAARFTQTLKKLIESGYGISNLNRFNSKGDSMKIFSIIAAIVLILHGLIHLMGTVTYMQFGTVQGLTYKISLLGWDIGENGMRLYGVLWAMAAVGFIIGVVALLAGWSWWQPALVGVTLFSLALTSLEFKEAAAGSILNIIILAMLFMGPSIARWAAILVHGFNN